MRKLTNVFSNVDEDEFELQEGEDSQTSFMGSKLELDEVWVNEFTEDSANEFRDQLLKLSKQPEAPIVIYIDSYGGEVHSLAKMIETLEEVPNPIITCCMGKAMSCAAILLSCGDMRYIGRNSTVMIHEASHGTFGEIYDVKNDADEGIRLNHRFLGLLAENCGLETYDNLREILKARDGKDMYLDAEAALEFGIVDEIGLPKVAEVIVYQVYTIPRKEKFEKEKPTKPKTTKPKTTRAKPTKSKAKPKKKATSK